MNKGEGQISELPELREGQVIKPYFEDPTQDVLQAVVLAVNGDSVTIRSITGRISVKARRNVVPLDINGPVFIAGREIS